VNPKRSRLVLWFALALGAIVLLAAAPELSVFLASGIYDALGCPLNGEACRFMGVDIGGALAEMFVFGWLAIDTVPLGAVALLIWLLAAVIAAIVSWRRR